MATSAPKYHIFTEKELKKDLQELIELHKRCIKSYLVSKSIKFKTRKKFDRLYDFYINRSNIRDFFFLPIAIFVQAAVKDQLENVRPYVHRQQPKAKKRKGRVHKG
jgi:hypothetical protein